ncbi:TetR/AcrR family transcriptional regulator [Desulfotomaculum defluvii]
MPYKTPKHIQEIKDAKYKHIIDVALRLFSEKGYQSTSIQNICSEAGISVGSIYFYFPNKKCIFDAVYNSIQSKYLKPLKVVLGEETHIKEIISEYIRGQVHALISSNIHEVNFFLTNRAQLRENRNDHLKEMIIYFKEYFDEAVKTRQMKPQNTELAASTFIYSVSYTIGHIFVYKLDYQEEELINFLINYSVQGLGLKG